MTSVVRYAPGSDAEADLVARHLTAGADVVEDPALDVGAVVLDLGMDFAGVEQAARPEGEAAGPTTSTSAPALDGTTPTTLVPVPGEDGEVVMVPAPDPNAVPADLERWVATLLARKSGERVTLVAVLGPGMSLNEIVGKIALQAIPGMAVPEITAFVSLRAGVAALLGEGIHRIHSGLLEVRYGSLVSQSLLEVKGQYGRHLARLREAIHRPKRKDRPHGKRQAQQHIAGRSRTRLGRSGEDGGRLAVGEAGDDKGQQLVDDHRHGEDHAEGQRDQKDDGPCERASEA